MSLYISVQKAQKGECIWIRYGEKEMTNIIIDSGPGAFAKDFRDLIIKVKENNEKVDLLVLTHIDDDHIKGFIKYIEEKDCKEIKKVWFNGNGSETYLKNQPHSLKNVTSLVNYMESRGLNVVTPICEGHKETINGAELVVITPTMDDINNVAIEIDKFIPHSINSVFSKDLDKLIKDDIFEKDKSKTNKASISFIFSYRDSDKKEYTRIAFLGDAHSDDIIKGKNKYFKDQSIDIVKIAHHGSKYNTSEELLKCMNSKKFIISTKGPIHKETIARIAKHIEKSTVYCNYDWWNNHSFFTSYDKLKYIDSGKLKMINIVTIEENLL